jgi:hypothetical protein
MNELIKDLLTNFGSAAVAVAAVGWLARSWILHSLKRSLETHKLELQAELEATNRRAIAELEVALRISEARVSKLHERRFEVLETLYQKMVTLFQDTNAFLSLVEFQGGPTKDDLRKKLGESLGEFLQFYGMHKLFFSRKVVRAIDALVKSVRTPSISFSVYITAAMDDKAMKGEMIKAWIKASDEFDQLAVPALEEVEEQFRSLLGVAEEVVPAAGRDAALTER